MMRDRVTPEQRLGGKAYTWLEITLITTSLLILGTFSYLIIIAITGVK